MYTHNNPYSVLMSLIKSICTVQHVSKCCGEPHWKTQSFPVLRKKLSEISDNSELTLGVCDACNSFFLLEDTNNFERIK